MLYLVIIGAVLYYFYTNRNNLNLTNLNIKDINPLYGICGLVILYFINTQFAKKSVEKFTPSTIRITKLIQTASPLNATITSLKNTYPTLEYVDSTSLLVPNGALSFQTNIEGIIGTITINYNGSVDSNKVVEFLQNHSVNTTTNPIVIQFRDDVTYITTQHINLYTSFKQAINTQGYAISEKLNSPIETGIVMTMYLGSESQAILTYTATNKSNFRQDYDTLLNMIANFKSSI